MTNTNWRETIGNEINDIEAYDYSKATEKILDMFQDVLNHCLKDQKAELLEKMPEKKEEGLVIGSYVSGREFNDCLEIIKGLIKGDV